MSRMKYPIYFTICRKIEGGADCHIHRASAPH
jgi:hypothetical protein